MFGGVRAADLNAVVQTARGDVTGRTTGYQEDGEVYYGDPGRYLQDGIGEPEVAATLAPEARDGGTGPGQSGSGGSGDGDGSPEGER